MSSYLKTAHVARSMLAQIGSIRTQLHDIQKRRKHAALSLINWIRVEQVIQTAAKTTHDSISYNLSSIASTALNEILGVSCYEVKIYSKEKRNSIELNIELYKDGELHGNPLDSNGGGLCDILSIVLLFVCWKMSGEKANLFILDEPFKNLSSEYQEAACSFFKQLSDSLRIKVLMVTHIPEFISNAPNVIQIKRKGDLSCIGLLKESTL